MKARERRSTVIAFDEDSGRVMNETGGIQALFSVFITLQFVLVTFHDLVDLPGWAHGAQVRAVVGRRKLWLATAVNSVFPSMAVVFVLYYWGRPKPAFVANYWLLYCVVTVISAVLMWYVPYFHGTSEERKQEYARMYTGTRQVLPPRGDNPRPNLLHICFHVLFVVTLLLSLILRFGDE